MTVLSEQTVEVIRFRMKRGDKAAYGRCLILDLLDTIEAKDEELEDLRKQLSEKEV